MIKPDSTILEVKSMLASRRKHPLNLDKDYINRLVNVIRKERAERLDKYTVNKVLVEFEDEVRELKKNLWVIINGMETSYRDKVSAIRELRNSSKDLFDKMFDAGVFKRKLGELKLGDTLTEKERDLIKKAIELDYGTKKPDEKPEKP